jgi:cell division protein FtsI/penicillin-binding protein 2
MIKHCGNPKNWKDFQRRLIRKAQIKRFIFRASLFFAYILLIIASYGASRILANGEIEAAASVWRGRWGNIGSEQFVKQNLSAFISPLNLELDPENKTQLFVINREKKLKVEISLNTDLQTYILKLLRRSRTSQAAVIALKPTNGQILAMASYDQGGKTENLCLKADFPAASLFKIISAAAAIEVRDFSPETTMGFKGMKHTLYKSQLKQDDGRHITKTTLKRAFSGSINPVFGKIGIYDLGEGYLVKYSDKFLFNQQIPFDLPLAVSSICIPKDAFGLAEIASGFNKNTRISPLHASLITATIVNYGIMVEPWLVHRIEDESGETLYRARYTRLGKAIEEDTARQMKILMKDTVLNGTCRKAFLPLRRKKAFQDIEIGAKTGTINDSQDLHKYDWITAYALPKEKKKGMCITVLAIHGEILGIRASEIARRIIQHHYTS